MPSISQRAAAAALIVAITAQGMLASAQRNNPKRPGPIRWRVRQHARLRPRSLPKSIRLDPGTVAGELTASNNYRMTGTRNRGQLKKADEKMVDVPAD